MWIWKLLKACNGNIIHIFSTFYLWKKYLFLVFVNKLILSFLIFFKWLFGKLEFNPFSLSPVSYPSYTSVIFIGPPTGKIRWIYACPWVRRYVCNYFFSKSVDFFVTFCTVIGILETEKRGRSGLSKKIFVCPKICKKDPNWSFPGFS